MSMPQDRSRCFGSLPMRAFRDRRLTGDTWRVLGAICAHDRMGANGQGCYASHSRLADMLEVRRATVTDAIGRLEEHGYLRTDVLEGDTRRRRYFVLYNEEDGRTFQARTGRWSKAANDAPAEAKQESEDRPGEPESEDRPGEPESEDRPGEPEIGTRARTDLSPGEPEIGTRPRTEKEEIGTRDGDLCNDSGDQNPNEIEVFDDHESGQGSGIYYSPKGIKDGAKLGAHDRTSGQAEPPQPAPEQAAAKTGSARGSQPQPSGPTAATPPADRVIPIPKGLSRATRLGDLTAQAVAEADERRRRSIEANERLRNRHGAPSLATVGRAYG